MSNTKVIDSIIESIKAEDFEGALMDTYWLDAKYQCTEIKRLRHALETCQKDMALCWANCCYGVV